MARERTGGTVSRRGKLYARVTYVDQFGKRREITRKALDRADARRIIDELHARLDQHGDQAVLNDRSTITEVIEQYRAEKAGPAVLRDGVKIAGLKSSYNMGFTLDVLIENFGRKKLRDLKPAHLHEFKKRRLATKTRYGKDRTVASVNRELEALRAVCRWSVAQGWLSKSPFELGEPVINKSHEVSRDRVLSYAEEEALLAVCTGRRARLRAIVITALDTAMRMGEILKCKWGFVSLAQGVVNVPPEITKTGKPRQVPLTPRVRAELEAIREKTGGRADELVFGVTDIKHTWQAACEDAQITGVRFHDLRHSAITRMIAADINPALVMKISGHENAKTFARYLNPEVRTLRDVADKLHDLNVGEWEQGRESHDEGYVN